MAHIPTCKNRKNWAREHRSELDTAFTGALVVVDVFTVVDGWRIITEGGRGEFDETGAADGRSGANLEEDCSTVK